MRGRTVKPDINLNYILFHKNKCTYPQKRDIDTRYLANIKARYNTEVKGFLYLWQILDIIPGSAYGPMSIKRNKFM